jgi:hypothetical protein
VIIYAEPREWVNRFRDAEFNSTTCILIAIVCVEMQWLEMAATSWNVAASITVLVSWC